MKENDSEETHPSSPPPPYREDEGRNPPIAGSAEDAALKGKYTLYRTLATLIKPPSIDSQIAPSTPQHARCTSPDQFPLRLNIVIQVVGSRGNVQPFIALGTELQDHGHRVRLATHGRFEDFVSESGLEFYPIGGDPEDLMSYMVKNPGLIPSMQSLRAGDIQRKRDMIVEMLEGCWRSCIDPDPITGNPFVADAIIANPPSFAHIHCAEALGIPVHLVFTMPWSATTSFPHPLANVSGKAKGSNLANYLSYILVEVMTWQGLGDVVNHWRRRIGLEPVPNTEGPVLASTLNVPFTYCWSPALVPRPRDWPAHIDVSGFFFRNTPDYTPPRELQAFLDAGPPPVYIGFGSIVLDDATEMSTIIREAVSSCGLRAIVSRGWSHLDGPDESNIFYLEDCPHEWLFQHVSAVVHHGGAGTAACGLRNARPTVVVPFFGDQPFWGDMIAAAGAGPTPIHHKSLTKESLAEALQFCQEEQALMAAAEIADQMKDEKGVRTAVLSFLNNLPAERMQCDYLDDQPASWTLKIGGKQTKISRAAAEILTREEGVDKRNFKVHRTNPIVIENRRWDPATGLASGIMGTGTDVVGAIGDVFLRPAEEYKRGRSRSAAPNGKRASGDSNIKSTPQSRQQTPRPSTDSSPVGQGIDPASLAELNIDPQDQDRYGKQSQMAIAGSMALTSGKSLSKIVPTMYKGFLVDWPLAVTEGFRGMPRLWGEEVKDYGKVTDWKSGGVVAGKSLVMGIGDGFKDFAQMPGEGAKKGGAWGALKGVAKGTGSLLTKTVSGGLGLVAYPGQGLTKTLWTLTHGETGKKVAEARWAEGVWKAESVGQGGVMAVLRSYHNAGHRE
ncbi:hypothetical protein MBLNU230_g6855t1 [Neophaeotheca triangularis]